MSACTLPFLPGLAAGVSQVLVGHPFDTIKTRIQAAPVLQSAGKPSRLRFLGRTVSVAMEMARCEGVRSFYRGVVPPLLVNSLKRSVEMSIWERTRGITHSPFLSGMMAGLVGALIACPVNVIKIQTQNAVKAEVRHSWMCTTMILRNEGILGFYRGLPFQIAKDVSFAGVYLGTYGTLRSMRDRRRSRINRRGGEGDVSTSVLQSVVDAVCDFGAGYTASVFTWTLLMPVDTLKTYAQARRPFAELLAGLRCVRGCGSPMRAMRSVVSFLWRGLPSALIRAGPVCGFGMFVYERANAFTANLS